MVVWFSDKGDLLSSCKKWEISINHAKSETVEEFSDELIYLEMIDYSQGAARVYFKSSSSGRKYSMFLDDFNKAILANAFNNNSLTGTFRFVKRGVAQSIKLVLQNDGEIK
jgi:hypothetical protein